MKKTGRATGTMPIATRAILKHSSLDTHFRLFTGQRPHNHSAARARIGAYPNTRLRLFSNLPMLGCSTGARGFSDTLPSRFDLSFPTDCLDHPITGAPWLTGGQPLFERGGHVRVTHLIHEFRQ